MLLNAELKNCERAGINNTYKGSAPCNEMQSEHGPPDTDTDTLITMLPQNPRSLSQGGITTFFQVSYTLSIPFGIEEPGFETTQT